MTAKAKKAKRKPKAAKPARINRLHASAEDERWFRAGGEEPGGSDRWNRPIKTRICVRVDLEVMDWLKSRGPGYQTRINQILRKAMKDSRKSRAR